MKTLVTAMAAVVALVSASFAADPDSTEAASRIDQLIALVPANTKLKTGTRWQAVGTAVANEALKTSVNKKPNSRSGSRT